MKKGISVLFVFLFVLSFSVYAQWSYQGPWPNDTYKGGGHGIVVDPDGKIWQASYYKTTWNGKSVSPIFLFNPDGTLLDTIFTVTTNGVTDTLGLGGGTSGTRGLAKDNEGNIIFVSSSPNKIIKIDYQTRQGLARRLIGPDEIGSSPTKPSVSDDGTIYIGPVVGGGTSAIATYDADLNYTGHAVEAPPNIARTMQVSPDGLTIYWTTFTGKMGIWLYTRADELSAFELTDSLFIDYPDNLGMAIESVTIDRTTDLLWVSNDSRGSSVFTNLTWYGVNRTTFAIVDSFTLPDPDPGAADKYPRAIDFSNDGLSVYVSLFGTAFDRLYKFDKVVGVEDQGEVVVNGYKLSQNYPNPFNPTTKINFELSSSGYTTLKIYDMLGNEVATLVQGELPSGSHSVNFNASNLASGTYLYQLNVNGTRITNKMVLLK